MTKWYIKSNLKNHFKKNKSIQLRVEIAKNKKIKSEERKKREKKGKKKKK